MTVADLILRANATGVRLHLAADGTVKASGRREAIASVLTELRQHREALVQFLSDSRMTVEAIASAGHLSRLYGDDISAQVALQRDVIDTPVELMADLVEYLNLRQEALAFTPARDAGAATGTKTNPMEVRR